MDSGSAIAKRVQSLLELESEDKVVGIREVYCSAPLRKEGALNRTLKEMGFMPVQIRPLQDA